MTTAMRPLNPVETFGYYSPATGMTMKRENGMTPNGNIIFGQWVFRSAAGTWIDFDAYRHDLAERNSLELIEPEEFTEAQRCNNG